MGASGSKGDNNYKLRLVLVGKTGVGKSAAGNTILRKKVFESKLSASSLTTECKKVGQNIAVIDTPGLFDTKFTQEQTVERIKMCISLSAPGPHAFVICLQIGRFTKEEKETVQLIQKIFGKEAANYTTVLFTHGDKLGKQSIESFIEENKDLSELIEMCHNRYHVFNNAMKDKKQTNQFLNKINEMIQSNGGEYYTNEMFKSAETAIEKEKERLLKESEEQRKKELEELYVKYAEDRKAREREESLVNERYLREAQVKAERSNEFVKTETDIAQRFTSLASAGAVVGGAMGPVGAAVGAAAGLIVGGVTELVGECVTQ